MVCLLLNKFRNRTTINIDVDYEPHVGVEVGSGSGHVIGHEGVEDNASATCGSCRKSSSK